MKRLTTEQFVERAVKIHGNRYNYNSVKYFNTGTKVCIICPEHGEFWQTPCNHLKGRGCPKCAGNAKLTVKEFIVRAKKIHGEKYDYSKTEYINARTKVCIICPKHGEFWQRVVDHVFGSGCTKCSLENKRLTTEEFIERATKVHKEKYDYSKVEYINNKTKVCIICKKHGEFLQAPNVHIFFGQGCPICKASKGELKIIKFLKEHNVNFIAQKTFPDCKNKKVLPFDFFLPDYNTLIEFDGIQHFEEKEFFGGKEGFEETQLHDKIKNSFAEKNKINLLRIPFWEEPEELIIAKISCF